jgi:hypothetical protein
MFSVVLSGTTASLRNWFELELLDLLCASLILRFPPRSCLSLSPVSLNPSPSKKNQKKQKKKKKKKKKDDKTTETKSTDETNTKKFDGRKAPGMEGMSDEAIRKFEEAMELEYQKREGGA